MAVPPESVRTRTFYGRRKGRSLSTHQQNLLKNLLPNLIIRLPRNEGPDLDPAGLFRTAKSAYWLEIGFGKGEHLAWQAERHPRVGFIGCEPYVNGVAGLLTRIEERALANIRIFPDEAQPLLAVLTRHCLERVFLLHPDPWPKRRHRERRFVSSENLGRLGYAMAPGAELRIGTDSPQYINWTEEQMARCGDFERVAEMTATSGYSGNLDDWPPTRYELKTMRQGQSATRLIYRRS